MLIEENTDIICLNFVTKGYSGTAPIKILNMLFAVFQIS